MKRIAIVEDDFLIAVLLEQHLQRMGYTVCARVDNGLDAIEEVKSNQPDLLLMDIKLVGDMDGIDTVQQIRGFSNVPVIFLTGNTDRTTKERSEKTSMSGYLNKPVDINKLNRTIQDVLN